ncbi:MAG: hypothetical protein AAGF11_16060 [Myxococcota bacterium]
MQDRSHGIEVDPRIASLAAELLGRHVPQLALDVHPRALLEDMVGHAEVGELDLSVVADEHVLRRDVTVDHPQGVALNGPYAVGIAQRVKELADDV